MIKAVAFHKIAESGDSEVWVEGSMVEGAAFKPKLVKNPISAAVSLTDSEQFKGAKVMAIRAEVGQPLEVVIGKGGK